MKMVMIMHINRISFLKKVIASLLGLSFSIVFMGCAAKLKVDVRKGEKIRTVMAVLQPTEGSNAEGRVIFIEEEGNNVRVVVELSGLSPGDHGFHIHQFGDCSMTDGTSAGGHFNPGGKSHGPRNSYNRHVGDLGNLTADINGIARADFIDHKLAFEGKRSIIGRAVIVHALPDDFTSQPTGAAGARVACGVIGITE